MTPSISSGKNRLMNASTVVDFSVWGLRALLFLAFRVESEDLTFSHPRV